MSGIITSKDGLEDLFAEFVQPTPKAVQRVAPPPTEHHVMTIGHGVKKPERVLLPDYDGPRLVPTRMISGWCQSGTDERCKVWYDSPGTPKEHTYNGKLPCTSEYHRPYLDTVFGEGWVRKGEKPAGKKSDHSLRDVLLSSNVTAVLPKTVEPTNPEVEVSDTTVVEEKSTEDFEYEAPEGVASVAVEVPAEAEPVADEPVAEKPAAEEAAPVADEKPKRAPRTDLEPEVKKVTDAFVTGEIKLGEGEALTPHRIAKEIKNRTGADKAPSTGAVSSVLDRWEGIGFATLAEKPKAFGDYTEAGRDKGLSALKAEAAAARKAAKTEA